jgi:hypothetical protein
MLHYTLRRGIFELISHAVTRLAEQACTLSCILDTRSSFMLTLCCCLIIFCVRVLTRLNSYWACHFPPFFFFCSPVYAHRNPVSVVDVSLI